MSRLKEANLPGTQLTKQQLEAIFTAISTGTSQLRTLYLQNNNLSSVEPPLLARAVSSLENLNLSYTQLKRHQLETILTPLSVEAPCLKILNLRSSPMSSVEADLLARAVNNLEEVNLSSCQLSKKQAEAILTESLMKTSLKRLDIRFVRLDKDLVERTKQTIGSLEV